MKRGEIWWADLGAYRRQEQIGRRPVIVWQSDTLTRLLQSVLVVPLTTNLDRATLAGTALIAASDGALAADSVALAFQMRAIPKASLTTRIRALTVVWPTFSRSAARMKLPVETISRKVLASSISMLHLA